MTGWTAIVPAKRWMLSKSRIEVGAAERAGLARAFAIDVLDVLDAAEAVELVIVVTGEPELAALARRLGHVVLEDRVALLSVDPLNDAVRRGRSWARAARPGAPVVVVPTDLPSLDPPALTQALEAMALPGSSYVPDSSGTGTTLLAASSPDLLEPRYGVDSARRHARAGVRAVIEVDPVVRRDVDTLQHLEQALRLGLGPETTRVARAALREVSVPLSASRR